MARRSRVITRFRSTRSRRVSCLLNWFNSYTFPGTTNCPRRCLDDWRGASSSRGVVLGNYWPMGALKRALEHSRNIASVAVVVDAIDENAHAFYRRYGFINIPNHPNRLFMPMKMVAQLFPEIETE